MISNHLRTFEVIHCLEHHPLASSWAEFYSRAVLFREFQVLSTLNYIARKYSGIFLKSTECIVVVFNVSLVHSLPR
jgi:hypothetical protein